MANAKEEVKQLIEKIPNDISFDDLIYEIYVNHQIQKGLKQVREGKTISLEDAEKRLLSK